MNTQNANPIFIFLDRMGYILDGVDGIFRCDVSRVIYPCAGCSTKLIHVPTAKGKRSAAYRELRQKMGDDWDTDLTGSIERYVSIAVELGFSG